MYSQHTVSNTRCSHAHRLAVLLKHSVVDSILTLSTWVSLRDLGLSHPFQSTALLYAPYYQAFICRIPPLYHLHTLIQHPAMPCLQSSRRYQMQLSLAILAALPKSDKNPKSQRRGISMLPPSCRRIIAQLLVRYRVSLTPRHPVLDSCWAILPLYIDTSPLPPLWLPAPSFNRDSGRKGLTASDLIFQRNCSNPKEVKQMVLLTAHVV